MQEYKAVVEEHCCEGFARGVVKEKVLNSKESLEKLHSGAKQNGTGGKALGCGGTRF